MGLGERKVYNRDGENSDLPDLKKKKKTTAPVNSQLGEMQLPGDQSKCMILEPLYWLIMAKRNCQQLFLKLCGISCDAPRKQKKKWTSKKEAR